ncbi:MAG: sugar phosphate isomerase/epimerase [Acidimicrobiales bacterium]|nr:sugar phosphate isomerase/epimerase [Acidimicrobiales bacterium]HCV36792.1 sugar phosphate isomerase/epimerase [Acidimicrobiaceae bacterium]HJO79776.1 sugar phosphate isomerase/epimerase [Acidimicrobiales bacterium]
MKWPIAFMANVGFEDLPAQQVAEELLELGYDTIEWTMEHIETLVTPACALSCQQDLVTEPLQGLQVTRHAIDIAAEREIPIVNVLTGPNLWEPNATARYDSRAWESSIDALNKACDYAQPLGVTISLEPCWGTLAHDSVTARRVLDATSCSVTFDPSHFVMTGDSIPSLVREWSEKIAHVHLKDAFGRPGSEGEDFHFCLLGEGKVPWQQFFEALDETGYSGPLSVEFEAYQYLRQVLHNDPVEAARISLAQVQALMAYCYQ